MIELTAERIRGAAEVIEAMNAASGLRPHQMARSAPELRIAADEIERKQTAETMREKRVQELAGVLLNIHLDNQSGRWSDLASALIARYPALAESLCADDGTPCQDCGATARVKCCVMQ